MNSSRNRKHGYIFHIFSKAFKGISRVFTIRLKHIAIVNQKQSCITLQTKSFSDIKLQFVIQKIQPVFFKYK